MTDKPSTANSEVEDNDDDQAEGRIEMKGRFGKAGERSVFS